MKKRLKKLKTDKEAESLLEQDLTDYIDPFNFKPVTFEFQPKDKTVTLRMSSEMLESLKKQAKHRGLSYQKFMREILEKFINKAS